MVWLATIIATILSAFAYRIGGMSKEQAKQYFPWLPSVLVRSGFRDLGCGLIIVGWCLVCLPRVAWFWYVLSLPVTLLALNTYWQRFFGGEDNFYAHGVGVGLALLFVVIPAGCWMWALGRAVILGLAMGIWCQVFSNDFVEEYGRGAFIIMTLPLLLI